MGMGRSPRAEHDGWQVLAPFFLVTGVTVRELFNWICLLHCSRPLSSSLEDSVYFYPLRTRFKLGTDTHALDASLVISGLVFDLAISVYSFGQCMSIWWKTHGRKVWNLTLQAALGTVGQLATGSIKQRLFSTLVSMTTRTGLLFIMIASTASRCLP